MENYFSSQRNHIFRNVQVLIFVFDVDSREPERDVFYYKQCLEALQQNSPDAKIFCLIHKMDLVPDDTREATFRAKESELRHLSLPLKITACKTSIWDETLYKAWSSIVYSLIPNVKVVESRLEKLRKICEADEVVLFEKATFLVISHASDPEKQHDAHRFEKISNIIKQFKLSCSKSQAQFASMEVKTSQFAAWIDEFTANNTYIMVVTSDPNIRTFEFMHHGVQNACPYFLKKPSLRFPSQANSFPHASTCTFTSWVSFFFANWYDSCPTPH